MNVLWGLLMAVIGLLLMVCVPAIRSDHGTTAAAVPAVESPESVLRPRQSS